MPLVVCIDTNVFVRDTHLLRKKAGPPMIHFLRAAGGRFLVPDILRLEYVEQTIAAVIEARNSIDDGFTRIQTLVGHRDDYQVPNEVESRAAAEARLAELGPLFLPFPTNDELLVAAGRRVISKKPPTTKSDHGYKDCVIWECILRMERGTEVRFISRDKAFFTEGALSPELASEAGAKGIHVVASMDLEPVLKELQSQGAPGFDVNAAIISLNDKLGAVHTKLLQQWSLSSLGPGVSAELEPFYTENPARLYITFRLRYDAGTAFFNNTQYSGNHHVELRGSCVLYPQTMQVDELQVEHEALIASDGSVIAENRTVFLVAGSLTAGRRQVPFQVKRPLLEGLRASAPGETAR